MTSSANNEAPWIEVLRADIAASGSVTNTATRVGVSRTALSQVLNGVGPYGTGAASTAKLEEKVMNSIGLVACPFLSTYHSAEHRITGLQCREFAYRKNPPTNGARDMQHWRACQECPKRVKAAPPPKVDAQPAPSKKAKRKTSGARPAQSETVEPQQAGLIDVVTLPLPVVGGPQVFGFNPGKE